MMSRWQAVLLCVVALLVPTPAVAHGEGLLFLFVYFPPMIVPGAVLLTVWTWRGAWRAKLLTALAVVISSAVMFGFNLAIQYQYIAFPFGNTAYLGVVFAQVVVPAVVWFASWRAASRRLAPDTP